MFQYWYYICILKFRLDVTADYSVVAVDMHCIFGYMTTLFIAIIKCSTEA